MVGEGRRVGDGKDHARRLGGPRGSKARTDADHSVSLRRIGVKP
jgi:hypothetical protein